MHRAHVLFAEFYLLSIPMLVHEMNYMFEKF